MKPTPSAAFRVLTVPTLILVLALRALAQTPTVTERGPHHRVWQYVTQEADETGAVTEAIHSYTELATGLHYLDNGQWLESKEEFELVEGAAVARQGQHQVILLANIADENAVDLLTPDDKRFISNPRYLSFYDAAANKNVLLAEVKDSIGVLVAPNVVLYDDCFDTLKGAIRYTYTRSSFEQDILLYEDPGSPADHGLNPETTLIEIYSEFSTAPEPRKLEREVASGLKDEILDFEAMQIGPGKAFALLDEGLAEQVGVAKSWSVLDQRQFLVESAPYLELKPLLEALPAKPGAKVRDGKARGVQVARAKVFKGRERLIAGLKRARGDQAQAKRKPSRPLQLASAKPGDALARPAVVIDYTTINGGYSDYVFKGDETYFVSGAATFSGSKTTFEAGTVIKYTNLTTAKLTLNTPIVWQGTPYRPVVLTARDDWSVGQGITPSNSLSGYYAGIALEINASTANADASLQNLRITRAQTGIALNGRTNHVISHAQLVDCQNGIKPASAEFRLRNALFANVLTNFNGTSSTGRCEHVTVDTASWLNYNSQIQLNLTNSLLAGVTNLGTYSGSGNATASSPSGLFQSVGAGAHYLAAGSAHRDAGITGIDPILASVLKKLTTYPPVVLTTDFTTSSTLSPQAQRDADTPDRGFHYDPLDYCWSALNLTNATLTLTNGVAVGIYGTKGTTLRTGAKFISEGTPTSLNRLVRYPAVQEQPTLWGAYGSTMSLLDINASSPPEVRFRFTDVSLLADTTGKRHLLNVSGPRANPWAMTDCQLRGIYTYIYSTSGTGMTVTWTNSLFQRCNLTFYQEDLPGYYSFTFYLYNNLFRTGSLSWTDPSDFGTWTLKDNLFDSDTLSVTGGGWTAGNNGYRSGLTSLGGSGNKTGLVPDYQGGAATNWFGVLGNFYYPTNGAATSLTNLLNAGSRLATTATLYHFTTTTNQVKEASTQVDIGYHYVAADANNQPNDYDGDGLPDYLEDRNGNGSYDSGSETDWQTYNSPNGLGGSLSLHVFTPLR